MKFIKARTGNWIRTQEGFDKEGTPIEEIISCEVTIFGKDLVFVPSPTNSDWFALAEELEGKIETTRSTKKYSLLELAQRLAEYTRQYQYDSAAKSGWQLIKENMSTALESERNQFAIALENFLKSEECEKAFDSSTEASWGGSGYSLELFPDGTYRVLWNNQIGNLYDSPGMILGIPPLTDEEWDDDPDLRFYETVREGIEYAFLSKIEEMEDYR